MFKQLIVISLALASCCSSPIAPGSILTTEEPLPSCDNHDPNKGFVDPKNPNIFYQCVDGINRGRLNCPVNMEFDEDLQVCVRSEQHSNVPKCPEPNGTFTYPGNPHMYIQCYNNISYARTCYGSLVFDDDKDQCVYNEHHETWPSDPTASPHYCSTTIPTTKQSVQTTTQKPIKTTENPIKTTETPIKTTETPIKTTEKPIKTTEKPLQTTVRVNQSTIAKCTKTGFYPDSTDKTKYHVCRNGKELTLTCPDGMEFDPRKRTCV